MRYRNNITFIAVDPTTSKATFYDRSMGWNIFLARAEVVQRIKHLGTQGCDTSVEETTLAELDRLKVNKAAVTATAGAKP